jgi:hypothetical protein
VSPKLSLLLACLTTTKTKKKEKEGKKRDSFDKASITLIIKPNKDKRKL